MKTDLLTALKVLRWPLTATTALLFAGGRLVENVLLSNFPAVAMGGALDPLLWGLIAGGAVWVLITWAMAQEKRYRRTEARMLGELRASNHTLELLYDINQHIASSATLDELLDYAITLPTRLVGAQAAAITLLHPNAEPLVARTSGLGAAELLAVRAVFGLGTAPDRLDAPRVLPARRPTKFSFCVIVPLSERVPQGSTTPALGWIEAYFSTARRSAGEERSALDAQGALDPATATLLITAAGEVAEALIGARRRSRAIDSVVALEQAITEERTRIAHDLHDGIAQSLAFLRMRVDLWEDWIEQDPARLRAEFVEVKANLRRQIEELRRAIFALRPVDLAQLGFEGALRRFVSEFADQQDWDLTLDLSAVPLELPLPLELAAFRVVQEALNNAAKHAAPQHVTVRLALLDGGLQILVRDDGRGFDPGALGELPASHLGLRQMRERIESLDGQLTVISRPGSGTELRIWLPLVYAREDSLIS
jgi:signal transduction histidine kinase